LRQGEPVRVSVLAEVRDEITGRILSLKPAPPFALRAYYPPLDGLVYETRGLRSGRVLGRHAVQDRPAMFSHEKGHDLSEDTLEKVGLSVLAFAASLSLFSILFSLL